MLRINHWPHRTSPPPELMKRLVVPLKSRSWALSDSRCVVLYGLVYGNSILGVSPPALAVHCLLPSLTLPYPLPWALLYSEETCCLSAIFTSKNVLFTSNLLPISQQQKSKFWLLLLWFPIGTSF